jgi:hypothetical protein
MSFPFLEAAGQGGFDDPEDELLWGRGYGFSTEFKAKAPVDVANLRKIQQCSA